MQKNQRMIPVDAEYLLTWLSRKDIKLIREGNNPEGTVLSQRQVHNIIHGKSKNFSFRAHLVEVARRNEKLHGGGESTNMKSE